MSRTAATASVKKTGASHRWEKHFFSQIDSKVALFGADFAIECISLEFFCFENKAKRVQETSGLCNAKKTLVLCSRMQKKTPNTSKLMILVPFWTNNALNARSATILTFEKNRKKRLFYR